MKNLLFTAILFCSIPHHAQVNYKLEKIIKRFHQNKNEFELIPRTTIINEIIKEVDDDILIESIQKSTDDDLKLIAIEALFKKNKKSFISEFKKTIHSTKKMKTIVGCIISENYVSTNFLEVAFRSENDLSLEDIKELLQIVQTSKNDNLFIEALFYFPESSSTYDVIKEKTILLRNDDLLSLLATYKKPADIDLIKSFGSKSYGAIYQFPDEKFIPFLAEEFKKEKSHFKDNSPILEAVSKICHPTSKDLLDKAYSEIETHLERQNLISFCYILARSECPLYDEIEEKLWLKHKIISLNYLENSLKRKSNQEVISFLSKGFENDGEIEFIPYLSQGNENSIFFTEESDFTGINTFCKVVNLIKNDTTNYKKAVGDFITQTDAFYLPELINSLQNNSILVENGDRFLEKMGNSNAYTALNITESIFSLNNKNLSEKAFAMIKVRKKEFESHKIWRKSLHTFLSNYHLKLD